MTDDGKGEVDPFDDGLGDALRVAFRRPSTPPEPTGAGGSSVLARLEQRAGSTPRILLPEPAQDAAALEPPLSPLTVSPDAGRYQVAGRIAEGGVGVILHARDVDLGREVALKVLRPDRAGMPDVLRRFVEEAQIGGQLQHPGIVPVYELGLAADGRPFFSMKLVRGRTLAALLAERPAGAPPDPGLLRTFLRVCETVAYAHARSVVHRDLKPSNVMVGSFGEVQVVDWGMAKVLRRGGTADERPAYPAPPADGDVATVRSDRPESQSRLGSVMGTLAYMPPEQASGRVDLVDERADVFALGAILCEVLTGRPPYVEGAESVLVQAYRGRTEGALLRLAACGAHADLVDLATRCLALDRALRPRRAGEVADAVARHLSSLDERARRAEVAAAQADVRAREERKRRRLAVALGSTVVAACLLGGAGWLGYDATRRHRLARDTAAARSALAEALTLEGGARRSAPTDVEPWEQAVIAARQAAQSSPDAEEGVRGEISAALARIDDGRREAIARRQRARRDREMTGRLEEFRLLRGDTFDPARVLFGYRTAFAEYGIPIHELADEEAAQRVRASAIAGTLCTALDNWGVAVQRHSEETSRAADRARLHRIAGLADPDPWRARVRGAVAEEDRRALEEIAASADPGSTDVASLTLLAEALAESSTPRAGVALLERVHASHPADFWVNYLLATWLDEPVVSAEAGGAPPSPRSTEAIGYYRAALAVRPGNREVRHQLGCALEAAKDWGAAVDLWRAALATDPGDHHAWSHLYPALGHTGGLEEEARALAEACEAETATATTWMRLGIARRVLDRVSESMSAFERAIELDPALAQARYGLGSLQRMTGRNHDAERTFTALVRIDPGDVRSWRTLAELRGRIGDRPGAVEAWDRVHRLAPFALESHVAFAGALARADRLDEAHAAYEELRTRFPGRIEVASLEHQLAASLELAGRGSEGAPLVARARAAYEAHLLAHPEDAKARVELGTILCDRIGDLDGAIAHFRLAEGDASQGPLATHCRGVASRKKGDLEEALAAFRLLSERAPGNPQGVIDVAELLILQGRLEEALTEYETGEVRFPRVHWVRNRAAWCELALGRPERALPRLRSAVALVPDHPMANYQAGLSCLVSGHEEEGLERLRHFHRVAAWTGRRRPTPEAWEGTCRRLARLAHDFPEVSRGTLAADDPEDVRAAAFLCYELGYYLPASRYFERLFRHDPAARSEFLHYSDPALVVDAAGFCAAGIAAGRGSPVRDAGGRDARAWRDDALDLLREGLVVWERLLAVEDPAVRPAKVANAMSTLRWWPDLAQCREPGGLDGLAEDERSAWRDFWRDVSRLERLAKGYR